MPDARQNAAFSGVYADFRLIKTRSVMQAVIEIPIEQSEQFVELFGLPRPGAEIHVAVARLQAPARDSIPRETRGEQKEPAAAVDTKKSEAGRLAYALKTPGEKAAAKAALLCKDKSFRDWIGMGMTEEMAAQWMRERLGIASRGDLATDPAARDRFLDIVWQFEHREDPNA